MSYDPTDLNKTPPTAETAMEGLPAYNSSSYGTAVNGVGTYSQEETAHLTSRRCQERREGSPVVPPDSDDDSPSRLHVDHLNLDFDECFREHKSTKIHPLLHTAIRYTYHYTKLVVYHAFVLLLGILMAFIFAIVNGIVNFVLVWLWGPSIKITVSIVYAAAPAVKAPYQVFLAPLADIGARMFRQIRVKSDLSLTGLEKIPMRP